MQNDHHSIHLVLLSGGSGTRLWPLSNEARSKQFLKVLRDDQGNHVSMVQRTFSQINNILDNLDVTIATSSVQQASLNTQIEDDYALVIEPERRDTAPAIMLSCANLLLEQRAIPEDTVIVMPIDSFAEQSYFDHIIDLDHAVQSGSSDIVLLGVEPTYPSEKYGYIVPEKTDSPISKVKFFVEKPNEKHAEELIEHGALWNCGVFSFKLKYMIDLLSRYMPFSSYDEVVSQYSKLPNSSFDYEVLEKAKNISVISHQGLWKDLGTWNTLTEEMVDAVSGRAIGAETCENTHIINELDIPIVSLGLKDAVIVATPDGILVSDKHTSSYMKPYVEQIGISRPMYERRNWGEYRAINMGAYQNNAYALTKELTINSGCQLSYQKHSNRSEIWTIVSGDGEVVIDGNVFPAHPGNTFEIPKGHKHSIRAFEELHVIEVQLGSCLEEEDIERFGFFWVDEGRIK